MRSGITGMRADGLVGNPLVDLHNPAQPYARGHRADWIYSYGAATTQSGISGMTADGLVGNLWVELSRPIRMP